MDKLEINKLWDDFLKKMQFSDFTLLDIIYECKRCFIDPKIFQSNLFLLSGHRNFYPETGLLEPTESLQELIRFLPPSYPMFFAAAFPDVIVWYQNIYHNEAYDTNPYLNELRNNPSRYFDEETGKPTKRFLTIIVYAYGKDNPFECSINILSKEQIQDALASIKHTDPPFRTNPS